MPARGLCAATRRAGGDVASRWYHYVNDPLGTPQRLLDDRGDVAGEVRLSAWGKAIGEGEEGRRGGGERGVTTPIRFLGQYADEETGLVYNRHQYYDPESGRFISPDPIGLEGGLNLYARGVDPTAEADVYGKYIDWVTPSPISAAEKKSMRDAARARFDADPDLKARQASLKVPRNAMQCAGVADAARRAGAGKPLQIVGLPKDDHDNEQLESWDDSIGKPRKWVDHWVNEEPDGRIVDYDQWMVFDNRQQYATAMFEKSACRLLEGDRGMVTVRAPRVPLEVVYYKATLSPSEALLRHVCSLGVDGVVIEDPVPKEGRVHWPFGDVTCSIHLFFVRARCGPWNHAIEDLVAMEAAANHGDTAFAQELAALKRAQTIVLVVEDAVPRFGRTRHFVKMLRADLIAAGRDPDAVPVVFQINRSYQEGVPTMPLSDLLPVLTWSRCDHVQAFAREKRGAKEALDRAIALYEEMKAEREAK